ncbi:hypothetical protein ACH5RR_029000 [Cinchona calisaya]|uniref:At1g61320/AtMIF1 LRR domain-containing protein n=1 Tax=Cinchona calisaya TaxID=153742 RepID=A0ABD2YS50_9GENT
MAEPLAFISQPKFRNLPLGIPFPKPQSQRTMSVPGFSTPSIRTSASLISRSSEIQVKQKYDVGNNEGDGLSFYSFPLTDLKNCPVEILKIRCCFLTLPAKTGVSSLKSLYLSDTCLKGDEIEGIISICSNLEFLSIEDAWFLEDFKIESSKLKELRFCKFRGPHLAMKHRSVKILAPCLDSMRFISFYLGKYDLEDVPSLVKAHVEFESREKLEFACWSHLLRSLGGIEHLTVQNMWIWSLIEPSKLHSEFENDEEVDMQLVSKSDKEPVPDGEKKRYGKGAFVEPSVLNPRTERTVSVGLSFKTSKLVGEEAKKENLPLLMQHEKAIHLLQMLSGFWIGIQMANSGLAGTNMDSYLWMVLVLQENLAEEVTGRIILRMRNLRVVKMKNYRGTKNELCVKDLLIRHKVALERIVALPPAEVGGIDYPLVLWPRTFRH